MVIRLRVSNLDAWCKFLEPEIPEWEVEQEDFIAQLRGETEPNDAMLAGTAFHALMETANLGDEHGHAVSQGFTFAFTEEIAIELPVTRESEISRIYDTPSGPVLLTGHIDGQLADGTVIDYKLTKTFDAERYADSMQWRAYLDIIGARRFRYIAIENKLEDRHVIVRGAHTLDFWAYPEMHADVQQRVAELAEFVVRHVPEKCDAEEVAA